MNNQTQLCAACLQRVDAVRMEYGLAAAAQCRAELEPGCTGALRCDGKVNLATHPLTGHPAPQDGDWKPRW